MLALFRCQSYAGLLSIAIVVLFATSGCAVTSRPGSGTDNRGPLPASTRPAYNLAGYPQSFKDGYIDGCETAKASAWGWKDESRFKSDAQYRLGWGDGFNLCHGKQ